MVLYKAVLYSRKYRLSVNINIALISSLVLRYANLNIVEVHLKISIFRKYA